ncbi:hypothetical protein [Microbacterium sp. H6]|uniref:hypothetical protein n=1 Tax=Microbacterium sp. H6 TaxID=421122 RepID=UPI000DE47B31|nr:hypothetical protein [Microbacterium sp. H6]RBO73496.1 hypothetical protein DSP71_04895 [Microbacterium sp. H6]
MSADILSDPTHPHGTTEGFDRGCRGSHCPADVSCRVVHLRYNGDFAFHRAIDSGMTPAEFVEQERARPSAPRTLGKVVGRRQYVRRTPGVASTPYQQSIINLHALRLTDAEIAERLGKTRDQICATRRLLKLKANRSPRHIAGVSSS